MAIIAAAERARSANRIVGVQLERGPDRERRLNGNRVGDRERLRNSSFVEFRLISTAMGVNPIFVLAKTQSDTAIPPPSSFPSGSVLT